LSVEQNELGIICESLETKARGFELQAEERAPFSEPKDGHLHPVSVEMGRRLSARCGNDPQSDRSGTFKLMSRGS
jgi:hypothetical protein